MRSIDNERFLSEVYVDPPPCILFSLFHPILESIIILNIIIIGLAVLVFALCFPNLAKGILCFIGKVFVSMFASMITLAAINMPTNTFFIPFVLLTILYVWIFYILENKFFTHKNTRTRKGIVLLGRIFGLGGMIFGFVGLIFSELMRFSGSVSGLLGVGSMYGYKKHKETGEIERDNPAADAIKRISEKAIYGKNYKNPDDDKYEKY